LASTALAPVAPLGSYELRLDGAGPEFIASLHTLLGPLQVAGSGTLGTKRRPAFSAIASIPGAEREQLAPFLRLVAVEQRDGSFTLQIK
jgi:hypothetical protein